VKGVQSLAGALLVLNWRACVIDAATTPIFGNAENPPIMAARAAHCYGRLRNCLSEAEQNPLGRSDL
jgi:hypothetical protein